MKGMCKKKKVKPKWQKTLYIVTAALAAVLSMSFFSAHAADLDSDLIGYYKFNGTLKNELGGEAELIGAQLSSSFDDEPTFETGYKDASLCVMSEIGDGLKLDCVPKDNTYTISFWAKAETEGFAAPLIWIGSETHRDASYSRWIGKWADFNTNGWGRTPSIGSNDEQNSKVGAIPEKGLSNSESFGWTYITMTVNDGYGALYYNGTEVANTTDNFERSLVPSYASGTNTHLPSMFGGDGYDDSAIYVAVNAWDAPPTIYFDELRVYDGALTADEIAALYATYEGHTPSEEDPNYVETTDTAPADSASGAGGDAVDNSEANTQDPSGGSGSSGDDDNKTGSKLNVTDIIIYVLIAVNVIIIIIICVIFIKIQLRRKNSK